MIKLRSARQKGKLLEDFIVRRFRETNLDNRAYRQKGSGNGLFKGDVWNDLGLCIEAKNQKRFLSKWIEQTSRQTMHTERPVIVWHPPHVPLEESKVMIDWDHFEQLLIKAAAPKTINPDRALVYKAQRAKQAIADLMKELK